MSSTVSPLSAKKSFVASTFGFSTNPLQPSQLFPMLGHKASHSFFEPEAKYVHAYDSVDIRYPRTAFQLADNPK